EGWVKCRCRAVIERVGGKYFRMDVFEAEIMQWQRTQERRRHSHGVDGRTHVVVEAGDREFSSAHPSADGRLGLQQQYLYPCLLKGNRSRKPIRAGADNDGVV